MHDSEAIYAHGIPPEAVKDRKLLKDFQNSKFEHYAVNSKKQGKQFVVGFEDD
jgi:hypothetical protein